MAKKRSELEEEAAPLYKQREALERKLDVQYGYCVWKFFQL